MLKDEDEIVKMEKVVMVEIEEDEERSSQECKQVSNLQGATSRDLEAQQEG